MSAREALYAVVETAYGTAKTTPVVNTDAWYFNLPDSDAFSGVMSPIIQDIPYGGGIDVPFDAVTDHYSTMLSWKGLVYPSLDNFLLNLCVQRINTGQTAPWTTTEPAGDLASASMYKLWQGRTGSGVRKQFPGCKCTALSLDCSRADPKLKFTASLVGKREVGNPIEVGPPADPDATVFPMPTDAQLPLGPYLFSHTSTNLSVGGAPVTQYQSVGLKVTNALDVLWFESKFPSVVAWCGRTIELTFQRLLKASPDYRGTFQGLTNQATYLKFDNGTNSFKVDLGARCHFTAFAQNLALGKEFLETVSLKAKLDLTTGVDCTLTFT